MEYFDLLYGCNAGMKLKSLLFMQGPKRCFVSPLYEVVGFLNQQSYLRLSYEGAKYWNTITDRMMKMKIRKKCFFEALNFQFSKVHKTFYLTIFIYWAPINKAAGKTHNTWIYNIKLKSWGNAKSRRKPPRSSWFNAGDKYSLYVCISFLPNS